MSCRSVDFALGTCLVEITADYSNPSQPVYNVYVSLVEKDGAVIRPVVGEDGHRVRIRAGSEPLALLSAISYLRARLGEAKDEAPRACSLGMASVGPPIPLSSAS